MTASAEHDAPPGMLPRSVEGLGHRQSSSVKGRLKLHPVPCYWSHGRDARELTDG